MKKTVEELQLTHQLIDLSKEFKGKINGVSKLYIYKNNKFDVNSFYNYVINNVNVTPGDKTYEGIYKQCSVSKEWYSINEFKIERRKDYQYNIFKYIIRSCSWKYDFHNQTMPEQKAKKLEWLSSVRDINLQFIKWWMYGNPNAELYCLVSKTPIKKQIVNPFDITQTIDAGSFYLHHFLVKDGVSVLKEESPSKLLITPGLLDNITAIKDLMGTILLCDDAHKMIHSLNQNSGLEMYYKEFLPFGLKSQENYFVIQNKYPILEQIDYYDLVHSLCQKC